MLAWRLLCAVFTLVSVSSVYSDQRPQLVYGTYLGGRDKECASALAVDRSGAVLVVGHTPSPDFPVTAGAFSTTTRVNNDDWVGFVSRIGERGDRLVYSTFLGGNFRSSANAVAVDSAGRAFVAGSTCSSSFPTTPTAIQRTAPGSDKVEACDGFVAWLSPDGSRAEYATYLGGKGEDSATAIAVSPNGKVVYVAGYTSSSDFPVAGPALQSKLSGTTNGFLSAIDVGSGRLLYSTYLGGTGNEQVTGIVAAGDGTVFVSGMTDSERWPSIRLASFGTLARNDGFLLRIDPRGKAKPFGIRIGGANDDSISGMSVDSHGDIYLVGSTNSPSFPVKGTYSNAVGSAFVVKIDGRLFARGQAQVLWSRRLGGHDEDALLSVSADMEGSIFASGRSGSKDFPTTPNAFYQKLAVENDSILVRLRTSDGKLEYATFLGGTQQPNAAWYNDEAAGVVATPDGDVFVTGCTLDARLPVTPGAFQTKPKGNSEPFVLRLKFPPLKPVPNGKPSRH